MTNPSGQSDDPDKRHLDDLGRRIEAVREHTPEAKPAQPPGRLNVVYRLSTEFVAAVFVGMALGWGFDALTGLKPWGIIGFSVLGIVAAFYMAAALVMAALARRRFAGAALVAMVFAFVCAWTLRPDPERAGSWVVGPR